MYEVCPCKTLSRDTCMLPGVVVQLCAKHEVDRYWNKVRSGTKKNPVLCLKGKKWKKTTKKRKKYYENKSCSAVAKQPNRTQMSKIFTFYMQSNLPLCLGLDMVYKVK